MATTFMNLDLPVVLTTLGPDWATKVNAALTTIDSHDHSTGNGTKITPAGMDINADMSFGGQFTYAIGAVGFTSKSAAVTSATYLESLQSVNGSLYYVNSVGFAVQVTSGNAVNASLSSLWSVNVPASYPYTVVAADTQKVIAVDTTVARTINLPTATTSVYVTIKCRSGSCSAYPITVTPAGLDSIDGVVGSYTIQEDYKAVVFISDGISAWYAV